MNPKKFNDTAARINNRDLNGFIPPPSLDCHKCRYKGHGFICWSSDGSCMRTWVDKNNKTEGNSVYEKSGNLPAK